MRKFLSVIVFFLSLWTPSHAAVLSVACGESTLNSLSDAHGKAWQIDQTNYMGRTVGGYRYGSDLGYLNLGHQDGLKTDGLFALYRVSDSAGRFATFGSVGPAFLATTVPLAGNQYVDRYSIALMTVLGLQYRIQPVMLRVSWDRLTTFNSLDEDVVLVGVGRKF